MGLELSADIKFAEAEVVVKINVSIFETKVKPLCLQSGYRLLIQVILDLYDQGIYRNC